MTEIPSRTRDESMDALRVLACLMVIAMHVLASGKVNVPVGSGRWNIILFANCAVHYGVPLFFMLSGAFSRTAEIKKAVGKSVFYFLTFVLAALFYAAENSMFSGKAISFWGIVYGTVDYKYHLWFLLNMITVTLLSPFMNRLSGKELRYASTLMLLFIIGFKNISYFLQDNEIVVMGSNLISGIIPASFLFCGYYLLGKWVYEEKERLKEKKKAFIFIFIAATVLSYAVNKTRCISTGLIDETFLSNYSVFVFIQCVSLFAVFENITVPAKLNRFISSAVEKSFGIYIIHVLFVDILSHFGITPASGNGTVTGIFIIIFETLAVFLVSYLLSFGLIYIERAIRKLSFSLANRIIR